MNLGCRDELELERPAVGLLQLVAVVAAPCQAELLLERLVALGLVVVVDLVAQCLLSVMIYILRYRLPAFLGCASLV